MRKSHPSLRGLGLLLLLLVPMAGSLAASADTNAWVPYIPTAAQTEIIPKIDERAVVVRMTFPNAGYRVASPGAVAVAAGVIPGNGTYMSFVTMGTKIERYTGPSAQVITVREIRYDNLSFGTKNRFTFRVYDTFVEAIDF